MQEVILFYNGLGIPTRQILDSRGVIPSKTAADVKIAIQEMVEYSQKWHNETSKSRSTETFDGLAVIQAQLNNLGREIKKERGFGCLPSSTEANLRDQVKSILTTIEADSCPIHRIGSAQYAISTGKDRTLIQRFSETYPEASQSMPYKEKDPESFTLPSFINNVCFNNALIDLGASISVMPLLTYLNIGFGELSHTKLTIELADRTVKYPKGIAKHVLVIIGKFVFLVDFVILDMPEDIKVPLILRRPFLSTTYAKIDVYKRKITLRVGEEKVVFTGVKPASSLIKRVYMLSLRERMELNLEARLMGETLVLNRSLDPSCEDYIKLNDLNELIELKRNQGDDLMPIIEEGEVIKEFKTRDDQLGMDDVIVSEPFLREVGIKARRFEGTITLYKDDESVTYQTVRSHPRFKWHTNEQCNKIPPLLKVSEEDKMNGISHPYQRLKGFYKGVLNLGPDYNRDVRMEERLSRWHISVHEMK
uniref:Reverse transcriptase domain-containing protein n=1 Tax=Tanacetum cinerariifolium TaxID=118510 RepID=A0A6L2K5P0_TANCI|nr:hypothetical protein [Tanacetum cinerariifolium]